MAVSKRTNVDLLATLKNTESWLFKNERAILNHEAYRLLPFAYKTLTEEGDRGVLFVMGVIFQLASEGHEVVNVGGGRSILLALILEFSKGYGFQFTNIDPNPMTYQCYNKDEEFKHMLRNTVHPDYFLGCSRKSVAMFVRPRPSLMYPSKFIVEHEPDWFIYIGSLSPKDGCESIKALMVEAGVPGGNFIEKTWYNWSFLRKASVKEIAKFDKETNSINASIEGFEALDTKKMTRRMLDLGKKYTCVFSSMEWNHQMDSHGRLETLPGIAIFHKKGLVSSLDATSLFPSTAPPGTSSVTPTALTSEEKNKESDQLTLVGFDVLIEMTMFQPKHIDTTGKEYLNSLPELCWCGDCFEYYSIGDERDDPYHTLFYCDSCYNHGDEDYHKQFFCGECGKHGDEKDHKKFYCGACDVHSDDPKHSIFFCWWCKKHGNKQDHLLCGKKEEKTKTPRKTVLRKGFEFDSDVYQPKDICEYLNVKELHNCDELNAAYRKKAFFLHPDKPGGNTEEFKKLNAFYRYLKVRL
jgi:hypothetical protein